MAKKTGEVSKPAPKPHARLRTLDRLVGSWKLSGPEMQGEVTFEWLAGGFFLVQHGTIEIWGRKIIFVEYIGCDAKSGTLVSHLFDNFGDLFTYVWEIDEDDLTIWFGRKDSDNHFNGKFTNNGDSYSGAWQWPGGGYQTTATRVK